MMAIDLEITRTRYESKPVFSKVPIKRRGKFSRMGPIPRTSRGKKNLPLSGATLISYPQTGTSHLLLYFSVAGFPANRLSVFTCETTFPTKLLGRLRG